jgi:Ca-activated chloride channel family protein
MGFQWPFVLLSLLAVPVLVAVYVRQQRRRRRQAVRHSSVALIKAAGPRRRAWRRHVPFALVLGALAVLGVGAARPQVSTEVPISRSAIILALDVSGSMCSTDVPPNRLSAAQAAVRDFVQAQDTSTSIGLVLFSGFAQVAVAPSTDRAPVLRAIDGLTTGRGTTIGAAILKSVDAIAEINPAVQPSDPGTAGGVEAPRSGAAPAPAPPPRAPGTYAPEIVVLLTDGANTTGIEPVPAAEIAAERGVRVYPIGFGTQNPTSMV